MSTNGGGAGSGGENGKLDLVIGEGRGRTGGSTGLDLAVQRARHQRRRVKPLDGDLRSRTLSLLCPATDQRGQPIQDGASSPATDELPDVKAWMSGELDSMVDDRRSRVLNLGGGDRVMQENVRDLALIEFCRDFRISLTVAIFLGPELEDFRHAIRLLLKLERVSRRAHHPRSQRRGDPARSDDGRREAAPKAGLEQVTVLSHAAESTLLQVQTLKAGLIVEHENVTLRTIKELFPLFAEKLQGALVIREREWNRRIERRRFTPTAPSRLGSRKCQDQPTDENTRCLLLVLAIRRIAPRSGPQGSWGVT